MRLIPCAAIASTVSAIIAAWSSTATADSIAPSGVSTPTAQDAAATATPIKHLVIIFNENVSFDHYFATYPNAVNPPGEPTFAAKPGTPWVNNLVTANLLTNNPNFTNKANGPAAAEPFRLDRTQATTADQNHYYTAEQQAYDGGKADLFPRYTGSGTNGGAGAFGSAGQVMGYYDGNTVTAMWNYAQHFAMNDNAYADTYGASSPGMLNISSGQTNGMVIVSSTKPPSTLTGVIFYVKDGRGGLTMINDVDPADDKCSKGDVVKMVGKTIGDLLNNDGITWGSFMGGFRLDKTNPNGTTDCLRGTRPNLPDYIPHHAWFQYYASTANPLHLRPSSLAAIGSSLESDGTTRDPANHNYDLEDFYDAVKAGNFPSVSYVKLPAYQDGHAGYSNPLDEQAGTVELINFLEQQPDWRSTAVIIAWDDSDGWYDHVAAKVTSPSFDAGADQLDGPGKCGSGTPPLGVKGEPVNGRCGPGTRLPFLVISPWARANHVDHTQISLASVVRFIEDNWLHGARIGGGSFDSTAGSLQGMFDFNAGGSTAALLLDPQTGTPVAARPAGSAR